MILLKPKKKSEESCIGGLYSEETCGYRAYKIQNQIQTQNFHVTRGKLITLDLFFIWEKRMVLQVLTRKDIVNTSHATLAACGATY